jgi:glycosyltransferase involved in cell wall biosynthesis
LAQLFDGIRRLSGQPIEFHFAGSVGVVFPGDLLANPRVKVHGRVSREEVERLYRDSDVFILPTLSDGFALTQLEAMHWRLPLIASRRCGEVVQSDKNGVLLQEVSGVEIASVLGRLCASPQVLSEMSRQCAVPAHCTLDHFGAELLKLEQRLLGDKCYA